MSPERTPKAPLPPKALDAGARFLTTRWTVIRAAGAEGPERMKAMEQFARTYWYPVYAFIRRKGSSHESAEDLTQQFFATLMEKNWLAGVEQRETRFSTFLLTVLTHFLIGEHRRESRVKRGGGCAPLSLDMAAANQWYGAEPRTDETPERLFERRLAVSIMAGALNHMKEALHASGRGRQFDLLSPYLSREPAQGEYDAAAATLGITANGIAAAVLRLRREYREFVREEVAAGLTDTSRIDEEMRHVVEAVASRTQGG